MTKNKSSAPMRTQEQVARYARGKSLRALQILNSCMEDENAAWTVRTAAANAILDRALGKPKTTADVNVSGQVDIQHQHLVAIREAADLRLREIDSIAEADEAKEQLRPAIEAPRGRATINNSRTGNGTPARAEETSSAW